MSARNLVPRARARRAPATSPARRAARVVAISAGLYAAVVAAAWVVSPQDALAVTAGGLVAVLVVTYLAAFDN